MHATLVSSWPKVFSVTVLTATMMAMRMDRCSWSGPALLIRTQIFTYSQHGHLHCIQLHIDLTCTRHCAITITIVSCEHRPTDGDTKKYEPFAPYAACLYPLAWILCGFVFSFLSIFNIAGTNYCVNMYFNYRHLRRNKRNGKFVLVFFLFFSYLWRVTAAEIFLASGNTATQEPF